LLRVAVVFSWVVRGGFEAKFLLKAWKASAGTGGHDVVVDKVTGGEEDEVPGVEVG